MSLVSITCLTTLFAVSFGLGSVKKFADPMQVSTFKKIFGSNETLDVSKQFINDILYKDNADNIVSISLFHPKWIDEEQGVMYIDRRIGFKCVTKNNKIVLVEMQIWDEDARDTVGDRITYFMSLIYSSYTEKSVVRDRKGGYKLMQENLDKFDRVWVVGVCNFVIGTDLKFPIKTYKMRNLETGEEFPLDQGMDCATVEPKIFKTTDVGKVKLDADKWVYFLKNSARMSYEDRDILAGKNAGIKHAFDVAEKCAAQT